MGCEYVDYGCGFPVTIANVDIVETPIGRIPLIDHRLLADKVCRCLAEKPTRLTGNEVRYLRLHFKISLERLGEYCGVTHAAVKRWENKGDEFTQMNWSNEKFLRLFVLVNLGATPTEIKKFLISLVTERPKEKHEIYITSDVAPSSQTHHVERMECTLLLKKEKRPTDLAAGKYSKSWKPKDTKNVYSIANAA